MRFMQRSNGSILNAERKGLLKSGEQPTYVWTPLQNFSGTFYGQGHTIYGLYASSTDAVGFIRNVSGKATIQDLVIADSYFKEETKEGCSGKNGNVNCENNGGGIVGYTNDRATLNLIKCGFAGVVDGSGVQNGGLLGGAGKGTILNFTDSYNEGYIHGSGLIGSCAMSANFNVDNCYNTGLYFSEDATTAPLIGKPAATNGSFTIQGNNLGCANVDIATCTKNFTDGGEESVYVGVGTSDVVVNYWYNLYGDQSSSSGTSDEPGSSSSAACADDDEACLAIYAKCNGDPICIALQNKVNDLIKAGMIGVKIEPLKRESCHLVKNDAGEDERVCNNVYVLVLLDLDDPAEKFKMPDKLEVVEVNYESRTFNPSDACKNATSDSKNLPFSTTVLPFTMDVTKIHGAKFFYPEILAPNEEDAYWHVGVREVSGSVQAHTPYLVCPTENHLTFDGATDVEMTIGSTANVTTFTREGHTSEEWKLQGLYERTCFKVDDGYACFGDENEYTSFDNQNGLVYAFSGGVFFRAVNGRSNIFRAYILAPENMGSDSPSRMPGMMRAPSALSASEDVPSQMTVKILGSDADLISWVNREKKAYIAPKMEVLEMEVTRVLMASGETKDCSTWYTQDGVTKCLDGANFD